MSALPARTRTIHKITRNRTNKAAPLRRSKSFTGLTNLDRQGPASNNMNQSTNRHFALIFCLSLALSISPLTIAQAPDFAGSWAGVMNRPAGPAGLEIILARDDETWKATMKMRAPAGELTPTVEEVKINGSEITFRAVINGVVIHFTGKFAGDELKGTFESFRG